MPRPVLACWGLLVGAVAAWGVYELLDLGGADELFQLWNDDLVLWGAAAICLGGAFSERRGRTAWILIAAGLASWALGDTIWSFRFQGGVDPPFTSVSDAFWLAWYPLVIVGVTLLVRDRVPEFELHRWIDGIVVMLIVATPWVALFFDPIAERSAASTAADVIEFAYVLGDAIIVGAVVGVYALMAWRPGLMWMMLAGGLALLAITDAVFSVRVLAHTYDIGGGFNVLAAFAALLIAAAAWETHPGRLEPRSVYGWRAIALPLAAQALAVSIQIYAYFYEIPPSERLLTIVVLLIAMIQIVTARPRAPG